MPAFVTAAALANVAGLAIPPGPRTIGQSKACVLSTKSLSCRRAAVIRGVALSAWRGARRHQPERGGVRADMGGEYRESFSDVQKLLMNFLNYKAVRTVLAQLQENDMGRWDWLYQFTVNNKPNDAEEYCKALIREDRELGERVMVTRLMLAESYIQRNKGNELDVGVKGMLVDLNLSIYRARLMETIQLESSDVAPDAGDVGANPAERDKPPGEGEGPS